MGNNSFCVSFVGFSENSLPTFFGGGGGLLCAMGGSKLLDGTLPPIGPFQSPLLTCEMSAKIAHKPLRVYSTAAGLHFFLFFTED